MVFPLSLTFLVTVGSLVPSIISSPTSLEARQTPPSIKTTVGTWQFRGCRKDIGERILTFRFDVPLGNSAERCTDICYTNGYGLAGLEYGSECWCDNYLPYGAVMPDSDCNFVCPGDSTELCGAGNRLVLYENTAATPPSTANCINWRGQYTFQSNLFYAIPRVPGTGPTTQLFAIPTNSMSDPTFWMVISTCPTGCPYTSYNTFRLVNGIIERNPAVSITPNVGDTPSLMKSTSPFVAYNGFCAKPNPVSPDGGFIGSPVLANAGYTDKWALCPNTTASNRLDIVYDPITGHAHYDKAECQDVYIELRQRT